MQVWISTDAAINWSQVGANASWAPQSGVRLMSDSQQDLWAITDIAKDVQPNLWKAPHGSGYQTWVNMGPVAIGGDHRYAFGSIITKDDFLYIAGGGDSVGSTKLYNDVSRHRSGHWRGRGQSRVLMQYVCARVCALILQVWGADLSAQAGPLAWTQIVASAGWTRRSPSLVADSLGNLFIFGQFALPDGGTPDLLWMSAVATGPGQPRGSNWTRVDNQTCESTWSLPVPNPGEFGIVVDSKDRMMIVHVGSSSRADPSYTDATTFIQLHATPQTDDVNFALGYSASGSCRPTPPPPSSPDGGGLSGGAKAAIAISVLVVVGASIAAAVWWWRRKRAFSDIHDTSDTTGNGRFSTLH
jgi:hypothetical protein